MFFMGKLYKAKNQLILIRQSIYDEIIVSKSTQTLRSNRKNIKYIIGYCSTSSSTSSGPSRSLCCCW